MPLAHYTNVTTATDGHEPVYKNLFEVRITLPTALQTVHPNATSLLLENATKVSLPTYPDLQVQTQRFKYSTRLYPTTPESTSIPKTDITFNLNQHKDSNSVFVFRMLKDWYDLNWNNETGQLSYKRNLKSDLVTIDIHDREGRVIRRVNWINAWMVNFSGWEEHDWSQTDIQTLTASFAVDYWNDLYY
jgi:hypothetical protein